MMNTIAIRRITGLLLTVLCLASQGLAQDQAKPGGDDLAQQARNPTASLTMMQIVAQQNPSFHNLEDATQTRFLLVPIIPFKTGKLTHIARVTLPYVANAPDWGAPVEEDSTSGIPPNYVPTADINGLSDMAVFDLLIFPGPWEGTRIAAGFSGIIPTATDPALGTEKWSIGPAVGGLLQSGKLLVGGIVMANFSVAGASDRDDVNSMVIQPFASYGLGNGWSIELTEMMYSYNFNSSSWANIPLGGRIGKLVAFGNLPVRFYADAEYNFADTGVTPKWTFRFAIVPLI